MDKKKIIDILSEEVGMSPSELLLYKGELTDIGLTSLQFISFIVN